MNVLTPPRCLHGVVEFNSFNASAHHVNSDHNIWWLIELPNWFKACFFSKNIRNFNHRAEKTILVVAGVAQLNVVYSRSVKLNLRVVMSSNVIIHSLIFQRVSAVFKNALCCLFIEICRVLLGQGRFVGGNVECETNHFHNNVD